MQESLIIQNNNTRTLPYECPAIWQVRLFEVCWQVVPDSRSSCTEGSVAEVGPRATDEKCTCLCRAHSSRASVGDKAAVNQWIKQSRIFRV